MRALHCFLLWQLAQYGAWFVVKLRSAPCGACHHHYLVGVFWLRSGGVEIDHTIPLLPPHLPPAYFSRVLLRRKNRASARARNQHRTGLCPFVRHHPLFRVGVAVILHLLLIMLGRVMQEEYNNKHPPGFAPRAEELHVAAGGVRHYYYCVLYPQHPECPCMRLTGTTRWVYNYYYHR